MSANSDRYTNAVTRYLDAWNTGAPDALAKAVAAAWAPDGRYTDPLADVGATSGIAAVITAAHEQFPGFVFRLRAPSTGITTRPVSPGNWSARPTARRRSPASTWSSSKRTAASKCARFPGPRARRSVRVVVAMSSRTDGGLPYT